VPRILAKVIRSLFSRISIEPRNGIEAETQWQSGVGVLPNLVARPRPFPFAGKLLDLQVHDRSQCERLPPWVRILAQRIHDASLRNRAEDGKVYPWRVGA
jgi:hypothetical protein